MKESYRKKLDTIRFYAGADLVKDQFNREKQRAIEATGDPFALPIETGIKNLSKTYLERALLTHKFPFIIFKRALGFEERKKPEA